MTESDFGNAIIDKQRLRQLINKCVDWLAENLDLFDPFRDGPEPNLFCCKTTLELAWFSMYYKSFIGNDDDQRLKKILSFVGAIWQRPDYQDLVVRDPSKFRLYAMTYIALLRCGAADPSFHDVLQTVINERYVTAMEELPFRRLDLRHMLDCGGFQHNQPAYSDLYRDTLLAKAPSVLYYTDLDAYCLTHTIFYLTDFGNRPLNAVPPAMVLAIRWTVGALLGIYLRLQHWDLVGELLVCCRCLRWIPPGIFEPSWNALLAAQLNDGAIPGPEFSEKEMQEQPESDRKKYYFEKNYHTTIVGALAGVLASDDVIDSSTAGTTNTTPEKAPSFNKDQLNRAISRTRNWLYGLVEHLPYDSDVQLSSILQLLISMWVCEEVIDTGENRSGSRLVAIELQRRLKNEDEAFRNLIRCDAALVLLCAAILRRLEFNVPQVGLFIDNVSNVIRTQADTAELAPIRCLLNRFGLSSDDSACDYASLLAAGASPDLLLADEAEIATWVNKITVTSGQREQTSCSLGHLFNLKHAIPVWALYYLRKYQLDLGASLLRAMNLIDQKSDIAFDTGIAFILAQQRPDGRFGYLGPEVRRLKAKSPCLSELFDVYLPISFSCLWTIAETLNPRFRLLASVCPSAVDTPRK